MSPSGASADVPNNAGSSSNLTGTGDRDKQWLSGLRSWKAPELKLPKLLRAGSSRKSKRDKRIKIESILPKSSVSEAEEVNDGSPSPDIVAEFSPSRSVPQEVPSSSILNPSASPLVFDLFPWNVDPSPPSAQGSERHSSSSSEYGLSYRSRSSSGPSIYSGPDPSFPYAFQFESLESLLLRAISDEPESGERQTAGSFHSISPPMPELNSPDCGPSKSLGIDHFQTESNAILERFVKLGDGEDATQFLAKHDENVGASPMVDAEDISVRGPESERRGRQASGSSRSSSRLPSSTNRAFSARDTPFLSKIDALHSRPRKGGAEIPKNTQKDGPPTMDLRDNSGHRQATVSTPFPFPFIEDSDDEIVPKPKSHFSVVRSEVERHSLGTPFSSPIVEDD